MIYKNISLYLYHYYFKVASGKFENLGFPESVFLLFLFKIKTVTVFSNRGDDVSICHFKEKYVWLKNIFWEHRGPNMVLQLSQHVILS